MKHYVQLKDGVVFNYHQSPEGVNDSGPDVWEVLEEASDKLGMNYNPETGIFSEAELIKYATLNEENIVVLINETKYSSDVKDNVIITNPEVDVLWQWDGQNFINVIEKNNLDQNAEYVKSLDELAKQAEDPITSGSETVEVLPNPEIVWKVIVDDVDVIFETQQEMLDYIANIEREEELKMQALLAEGTTVED